MQGHVNKAEEFWKGVQSIYLSFVDQARQARSNHVVQYNVQVWKQITYWEHKHRVQFVDKLKAIENAMGLSLLLFFQPPLLTSDLLTDQEVTKSKEVTLSGGNEPADLVGSNPVGLRVVAFKQVS